MRLKLIWCTEHGYSCDRHCLYEKHDEPDEYTEFEWIQQKFQISLFGIKISESYDPRKT